MTEHHQFILALLGIGANTLFAILAWLKSGSTYHMVNSRMDEFKEALVEANEKSNEAFRKELQAIALQERKDDLPSQGEMDRKR